MLLRTSLFTLVTGLLLAGCQSARPPVETVDRVDLERFMGDWYVIANIPTFLEKDAYNAVESYRLDEDGTIATTFTFRKGGFDGKQKTYTHEASSSTRKATRSGACSSCGRSKEITA